MWKMLMGLMVVGCGTAIAGPPASYELRLDPSMTPEQTTRVLGTYEDWRATAGAATIAVVSSEACDYRDGDTVGCIHVRYGTANEATALCADGVLTGHTVAGCTRTDEIAGYVWGSEMILTERGEETFNRTVALHEAGHSFGLRHDIPGTLMSPTSETGAPVITSRDVAQFRWIQGPK